MSKNFDKLCALYRDIKTQLEDVRYYRPGNESALRGPLIQQKFNGRQRGILQKHFTPSAAVMYDLTRTSHFPETRRRALETVVDHAFFDPLV